MIEKRLFTFLNDICFGFFVFKYIKLILLSYIYSKCVYSTKFLTIMIIQNRTFKKKYFTNIKHTPFQYICSDDEISTWSYIMFRQYVDQNNLFIYNVYSKYQFGDFEPHGWICIWLKWLPKEYIHFYKHTYTQ